MISLVVVAILIVLSAPDDEAEDAVEGRRATEQFEADVAYAKSYTMARPDDPLILKVDVANNRYWLARLSAPDTPILHPQTKKPYLVQFGAADGSASQKVKLIGVDMAGDNVLAFDATGSTDQTAAAIVQFSSGASQYETSVSPVAAQTRTVDKFTLSLSAANVLTSPTATPTATLSTASGTTTTTPMLGP